MVRGAGTLLARHQERIASSSAQGNSHVIRELMASLRIPDEHREAFARELALRRGPGLWTIGLLGTALFPLF
jgi:hypothetical protein